MFEGNKKKLLYKNSLGNITDLEIRLQKKWKEECVFERSVEERDINNQYVLYDGPPFATGLPHYGHVLASTLKDVFPRFHTMQGKRVERRFGWDCHGVPIEYEIEKQLNLDGKRDIEKMGIAQFNEECRSIVLRYTSEWQKLIERLGRFVDMDNDYKTMEPGYMESVWAVFKKLDDKKFIYEDKKVVAYSPALGTPLSNFEAGQNYKKVADPAITISFPLADQLNTSFLVWTTTPWTIPTNVAIAINPDIEYVKVTDATGKKYILAKNRLEHYFKEHQNLIVELIEPSALVNVAYQPMFNTLSPNEAKKAYVTLPSKHVTAEDGTGLVHISPAFGEDDYILGKKYGLPVLDFIDQNGFFDKGLPSYAVNGEMIYDETIKGQYFKEADKTLIQQMKKSDRIFRHENFHHDYPHCWRTDKPLMYRTIPSWYVNVTEIKDNIIKNNQEANWYPDYVGKKRFHNWLQNARDWAISRNRYWGCPIPVWRNVNDANDYFAIGSIAELETLTNTKITDLHRHFIDDLVIQKDGKTYQRIPEVFDCWFESGAMPYAQAHYPFEKKEMFENTFPADFIAEGLDQTRGWFYTLMVLSTALFDKPAFKNCMVNGILLGDDGKKMSKSKRNYPAIETIFEKYGADPLRFLLLGSGATRAEELAVSEKDVQNVIKETFIPLMNIYKFFSLSANRMKFQGFNQDKILNLKDDLNKWLACRATKFNNAVKFAYENYNLIEVCQFIREFIGDLTNWYIRNSRIQFKLGTIAQQEETLHCLFYALNTLSITMAPVTPFIADALFRNIHQHESSVHLHLWDAPINTLPYEKSFDNMEIVRNIAHLGHKIREEKRIRTRQPLAIMYLPAKYSQVLENYIPLLKAEVNVKEIKWLEASSELLDKKVVLNTKVLGPKYKRDLNKIITAYKDNNFQLTETSLEIAGFNLSEDDYSVEYIPTAGIAGAEKENVWVVLDIDISAALAQEGRYRDLIRCLQKMRKEAGYQAEQQVNIYLPVELIILVENFGLNFSKEVNAIIISEKPAKELSVTTSFNLDGMKLNIELEKPFIPEKKEISHKDMPPSLFVNVAGKVEEQKIDTTIMQISSDSYSI